MHAFLVVVSLAVSGAILASTTVAEVMVAGVIMCVVAVFKLISYVSRL